MCVLLVPKQKPKLTADGISTVTDCAKENDAHPGVAMTETGARQAVAVTGGGSSSVGDGDKQDDSICGSSPVDATSGQLPPPVMGTSVNQEADHQVRAWLAA